MSIGIIPPSLKRDGRFVTLPSKLDSIVRLMQGAPKNLKVEALLDYSRRIPPLPEHIDAGELEQVHECQSPFVLATEVDEDTTVHLYFDAPQEAPTVRGFAGILIDVSALSADHAGVPLLGSEPIINGAATVTLVRHRSSAVRAWWLTPWCR